MTERTAMILVFAGMSVTMLGVMFGLNLLHASDELIGYGGIAVGLLWLNRLVAVGLHYYDRKQSAEEQRRD